MSESASTHASSIRRFRHTDETRDARRRRTKEKESLARVFSIAVRSGATRVFSIFSIRSPWFRSRFSSPPPRSVSTAARFRFETPIPDRENRENRPSVGHAAGRRSRDSRSFVSRVVTQKPASRSRNPSRQTRSRVRVSRHGISRAGLSRARRQPRKLSPRDTDRTLARAERAVQHITRRASRAIHRAPGDASPSPPLCPGTLANDTQPLASRPRSRPSARRRQHATRSTGGASPALAICTVSCGARFSRDATWTARVRARARSARHRERARTRGRSVVPTRRLRDALTARAVPRRAPPSPRRDRRTSRIAAQHRQDKTEHVESPRERSAQGGRGRQKTLRADQRVRGARVGCGPENRRGACSPSRTRRGSDPRRPNAPAYDAPLFLAETSRSLRRRRFKTRLALLVFGSTARRARRARRV